MQRTTNYNLKKPERVEASLIDDINDNMDTIDAAVHDTKDSVVAFTSSDVADGGASSWTNVTKVASGEKHSSLFAKMSQMFKNIRYLYKLLGTTDISSIGDGTVTGVLSSLNDSLPKIQGQYGFRYPFTINGIPYEMQFYVDYAYRNAHIAMYDTRTTPYTRIWDI